MFSESDLWDFGYSRCSTRFTAADCEFLRALYSEPELFRSRIDMARYRFGRGEYQYFRYPLPPLVEQSRQTLYRELAPVASKWMNALRLDAEYPTDLDTFLDQCHAKGQTRPTPLLLRYRQGDFNRLHQDLYGDIVFPFQVIIALSRSGPDAEFSGGELLLVEQQPRAQSIGHAISLQQGEALAITTRYRPAKGPRGFHRTNFRHGVSRLTSGERFTLGLIFHDAKESD